MKIHKRIRKEKDRLEKDTKVNLEPTDQQIKEFIAKKKGKEITEKIDTFTSIEQAGVKKPEIPKVREEEPRKKYSIYKMTDEEKEKFDARNEWIRDQRRNASIQKILKKMGQGNKYSPLIGKKINIRGELYEVKSIARKSKERKQ